MMLLTFIHQKNHHQSVDYLSAVIQLEHVVLGLSTALCSVYNQCVLCRKRKTKLILPMMADLPLERLGYRQPPFANCGVDFFRPIPPNDSAKLGQTLGLPIHAYDETCHSSLVVPSMDTSSCVMGIESFIARRGTPSAIWSDMVRISMARSKNWFRVSRTGIAMHLFCSLIKA